MNDTITMAEILQQDIITKNSIGVIRRFTEACTEHLKSILEDGCVTPDSISGQMKQFTERYINSTVCIGGSL